MAIASLGGAEISKTGARNYAGSGGYVGGLSMDGANWAYWTGAGKVYEKFTPTSTGNQNAIDIYNTGGTGYPTGGNTNGGGTPPIITGVPTGGGAPLPTTVPTVGSPNTVPVTTFQVPSQPFRGLSQITSGGNQVINSLNSLFAQLQAGTISMQDALLQGNLLRGYLNNPSVFYQARHGDDASALVRFRNQAAQIVNSILSWVAPTPTTPTGGTGGGTGSGDVNCLWGDCTGNLPSTTTGSGQSVYDILNSLIGSSSGRTNIEAPPNLYQFTPTDGGGGSGVNMKNILLLAALGAVAWWLYKKYA